MKPPTSSADATREILNGLRHIVRVLRVSSRDAEARTGLSTAQLFALQRLAQAPGLSLGELAARTHTDPSSVSVVAQRLVARGLVARRKAATDARRLELSLTARGRTLLRRAPGVAQDRLVAAIDALSPARRRGLANGLGELARSLGVGGRTPQMFFEETEAGRVRR